ncbi:hypothetical protein [Micromonospora sp. ATA51]|uniref:hypothetical protein n=1 Tax=Micromonospora sp. ATA51 TaxID=2806098 RepID=UPI0028167885|nr:hypothetical protein [Micromonospora sp. ATA51]
MTWQVEVPMIATIRPASVAWAAGAVTWASTLPTATAIPSGRPVQAAASAVSRPAASPSWPTGCSSLSTTNRSKPGLSAARKSGGGYAPSCRMPL